VISILLTFGWFGFSFLFFGKFIIRMWGLWCWYV